MNPIAIIVDNTQIRWDAIIIVLAVPAWFFSFHSDGGIDSSEESPGLLQPWESTTRSCPLLSSFLFSY